MTTKARKRKPKAKQSHSPKHSRYKVFISHSSLDSWIAERIAEKIEIAGADYTLDKRDFQSGGGIQAEIKKGVRESQEVAILFSPNSKDAMWVIFEVGAASQQGRHITPILYSVDYKKIAVIQGLIAVELNNEFDKFIADMQKRMAKWKTKKK